MTVQEFVDAVSRSPNLLKEHLMIASSTQKVLGGEFDGAVQLQCRPARSATIGFHGVVIFADPKSELAEIIIRDATPLVIVGPPPAALEF